MSDKREEFLVELYMGISTMVNSNFSMIPFLEWRTRMQHVSTDNIRQQVLELRKITKI